MTASSEPEDGLIEALFTLEPPAKKPPTRVASLTDAQFEALEVARSRGCSWKQIYELVSNRYKSAKSLSVAYGFWMKRRDEH
jgi:hypothetical protein